MRGVRLLLRYYPLLIESRGRSEWRGVTLTTSPAVANTLTSVAADGVGMAQGECHLRCAVLREVG
jgi:hypothetical protein